MSVSEFFISDRFNCRRRARFRLRRLLSFPSTFLLVVASVMIPASSSAQSSLDFDLLWNYENPGETERAFRALLPRFDALENPEHRLGLKTQIARTLGLQGDFEGAHALLDEVEAELGAGTPIARVRHLLERGRTLRSSGQSSEARPLFEEAWKQGRRIGADFHAVDAAHMVAIVSEGDEALTWNAKALTLAETSADERAGNWEHEPERLERLQGLGKEASE